MTSPARATQNKTERDLPTPFPPGDEVGSYKWKAMITVAVGILMATMDASITNIAFPTLTRVFHADLTSVMWVSVAYILVSTSSMLILGKVSDLVGRRRVYTLGMMLFTMGLIACSLARGVGELILYRCFQGLGAAMMVSCGTAIVTEAFPVREMGRGIGLLGISVSLGFIVGPILGGFLLHWMDWRSIFWVRAPVAFLSLLLGAFLLKRDGLAVRHGRLDVAGALTSSAGLFSLVYGISRLKDVGLFSPWVLGLVGAGLFFLTLFVAVERRAEDPILDPVLFRNRTFRNATLSLLLLFVAAPPFILLMPFYLIDGIGLSPSGAGLLLTANSVATIVFGPVSGVLSDRYGPHLFASGGAMAITAAFGCMLLFNLHTPIGMIVLVLILLGLGIGMFQAPNNSMIMGTAPREKLGTASALIATLRQVGLSLGMALAGTLYAARSLLYEQRWLERGVAGGEAAKLSIPQAFHDTLIYSICLGTGVILFSLVGGGRLVGRKKSLK